MEPDNIGRLIKLLRKGALKAPVRLAILLYILVKEEVYSMDLVEALESFKEA